MVTGLVSLEEFRNMLAEGKPFNEIMTDLMKIGSKLAKEIGHKDYSSFEEVLDDIKNQTSPLFQIDHDVVINFEDVGLNLIGVKKCPFRDIMDEMRNSGTSDTKVDSVMDGFQTHDGRNNQFLDLGCYAAQQLRQMVLSSLTVKGDYLLNYIHLGSDKGTGKRIINEDEVEAVNIDKEILNRLLDQVDCVYAIAFRDDLEGK